MRLLAVIIPLLALAGEAVVPRPVMASDNGMHEPCGTSGTLEFSIGPRAETVRMGEPWTGELLCLVEESLAAADGIYRLAVSPSTISAIKRDDDWLEISLEFRRETAVARFSYNVAYQKLFIPLSGELADGVTTFFVGTDQYKSGPLRLSRSPDSLVQALERQAED